MSVKPSSKRLLKLVCASLAVVLGIVGLGWLWVTTNSWYETHRFIFRAPVVVTFNKPISIEERKTEIVTQTVLLEYPDEIETPIQKYICDKWGAFNCRVALAVAQAESDFREDALNINTNDTIDVGIFQINSVHFKQPGCSLAEVVDPHKNVDCAYSIYEASGWSPWVAFTSGSFKSHL